ncbi:MAG: Fe-S cluster assembly scaffold protein NifU [Planctomycetota bacterium]|jgi:nitrogen fixation NifU-like protein
MEEAYSEKVMEHFMNPRNVGDIPDASGVGSVGNPTCGDIMKLFIKVDDGIITDAKFKTFGCGAAIATSSMITELIKGKTIEEARSISNRAVAQALDGLPPRKMHCSVLAEEALASALKDYFTKAGLEEGLEPSPSGDDAASPPCCDGVENPCCGRSEE